MLPKIKNSSKIIIDSNLTIPIGFKLQFDGCSKNNPGLAGAGAVIYHENDELWSDYFFVGEKATNNHAEYAGLILGLQKAIQMEIKDLTVEGDSLLVINQMNGKYKCNSTNLIELYDKAKKLSSNFNHINFIHIYRNNNKRADELSNIAIQNHLINNNK